MYHRGTLNKSDGDRKVVWPKINLIMAKESNKIARVEIVALFHQNCTCDGMFWGILSPKKKTLYFKMFLYAFSVDFV